MPGTCVHERLSASPRALQAAAYEDARRSRGKSEETGRHVAKAQERATEEDGEKRGSARAWEWVVN